MTISREEVLRRFQKDVKNHTAVIEQDDGVFRSIFCSKGSSVYHFRVTTWPGALCISGDMGTFVFERERDMIYDFFPDRNDVCVTKIKHINPQYWGEKVQVGASGAGRRNPILGDTTFGFTELVKSMRETFQKLCQYGAVDFKATYDPDSHTLRKDAQGDPINSIADAFDELEDFISSNGLECSTKDDQEALSKVKEAGDFVLSGYLFEDGEERPLFETDYPPDWIEEDFEYSLHYIWCCYAILWACKRYAQIKEGRDQKSHDAKVLMGEL